MPTYDINRAAAAIWLRKAQTKVNDFTFSADGASYQRGDQYKNAMEQYKFFWQRRRPKLITMAPRGYRSRSHEQSNRD